MKTTHTARAEMLIRKPASPVFNAFVDPNTITKFWLAATSGPLAPGANVKWDFMVPGASAEVNVTVFEQDRRIVFDWSDGTQVELDFADLGDETTHVSVRNSGYGDDKVDDAIESTQGFTIVLCDLKTLLERGRSAGLTKDKAALIERSL